jgi:hypothetical protein
MPIIKERVFMEKFIDKLQPKWMAVFLAIFMVWRAVTGLLYNEFGIELMSDGGQIVIYGLKFSYIANTIFLPMLFALLAVELAKNTLSPLFFRSVLIVNYLCIAFITILSILDALSFGSSAMQGGHEGTSILSESAFYRALLTLILFTVSTIIALVWQNKNYRIFTGSKPSA